MLLVLQSQLSTATNRVRSWTQNISPKLRRQIPGLSMRRMQKGIISIAYVACLKERVERGEHDDQRIRHHIRFSPPLRYNPVDGVLYSLRHCIALSASEGEPTKPTIYRPSHAFRALPRRMGLPVWSSTRDRKSVV